jgi:ATP-binding cassette subfamily B protein
MKTMLKTVQYKDIARFTWHYWKRRKLLGAASFGMITVMTAIDVFVPVLSGRLVDAMVDNEAGQAGALGNILPVFALFVGAIFFFVVSRYIAYRLWMEFAMLNLYDILTESSRKVMRFSADWHANSFAGATVRKITRGMWSFDMFEDSIFMGIYPAFTIALGMTGMLLFTVPPAGVFAGIFVCIYIALSIYLSVKIAAPRFRESAACDTDVGGTLADIVTGIPTVKTFGTESREDTLFGNIAGKWCKKAYRAWRTSENIDLATALMRMILMAGLVGITIWQWSLGAATPGNIALAISAGFMLNGYVREIGRYIADLQKSASEMEDVVSFWMRDDEIRDVPDAVPFQPGPGKVTFDRVSFTYNGQSKALFEDLSMRIAPGEKIALVGPSGSGKTTFVKLLQRLYDINSGEIRIDGQNVASVQQETLRRAIALVPQEPILFHRSLAENIAYGRPGASMEDIIDASRKSYAHEFISTLPQGYDTLVGERGIKLSGGERQRVAIARALLTNAPILVLDEATSSLDSISEHYIQRGLETLMEGRTTITVAHRLSTIRSADRILVFEHGKIIEQGRHEDLLARADSLYRTLFDMQAGGMIGDL